MNSAALTKYFSNQFDSIQDRGGGSSADIAIATTKKGITGLKEGVSVALKTSKKINENDKLRIEREKDILKAIHTSKKNPYVIDYYDCLYTPSKVPVLVLEWADEGNLDGFKNLKYENGMPEGIMDSIIERICLGFSSLHNIKINGSAGCAHRDIKPSNILVFSGGLCKLADFGSAGFVYDDPDIGKSGSSSSCQGTGHYRAPECFEKDANERFRYSLQSDIYSVGFVAFHLIAGQIPFERDNLGESVKLLEKKNDSKYLDDAIVSMLGKSKVAKQKIEAIRRAIDPDPSKRFATIEEFLSKYKDDGQDFFESKYRKLNELLAHKYSTVHNATSIDLVDASLLIYEEMKNYAKSKTKGSSLIYEAEKLIRARAQRDYKLLDNYIPVLAKSLPENDAVKICELITPFVALIYCWGNEFGSFVDLKHQGRIRDLNEIHRHITETYLKGRK